MALDTEADSLHAYPEKLCLVQLSLPGIDVLVDPLADMDLAPMMKMLEHQEIIIHAADYDLRLLKRCLDFVPSAIFDTMFAARFLGDNEFGLTHLASKYLGMNMEKGPQKADWGRRPLTEKMLIYAQNDTRFLKPLADILREKLSACGRLEWHREACLKQIQDCIRPSQRDPDEAWRVSGCDRLSREAMAVLRELWRWREKEAIEAGKPPYFVLSHELLIGLAETRSWEMAEKLLPARLSPRRREGLREAFHVGLSVPASEHPKILRTLIRRLSEKQHRQLAELKTRRDKAAHVLGMDPTIIASRAMLTDLAYDWDTNSSRLMNWQVDLLRANSL